MPKADIKVRGLEVWTDTREQAPLDLSLPTRVMTLDVGDYTLRGLSHLVRIERKSAQDLAMSCGRERERFMRSIERMRRFELAMLVIECSEEDIEQHKYRGEMNPKSIIGTVHSIRAKGINVDWSGSRERAALHISRTLYMFAKEHPSELQRWEDTVRYYTQETA